jgi:hypothetical protein
MAGRESGYGGQLGVAAAVCDTSIIVSQTVMDAPAPPRQAVESEDTKVFDHLCRIPPPRRASQSLGDTMHVDTESATHVPSGNPRASETTPEAPTFIKIPATTPSRAVQEEIIWGQEKKLAQEKSLCHKTIPRASSPTCRRTFIAQ